MFHCMLQFGIFFLFSLLAHKNQRRALIPPKLVRLAAQKHETNVHTVNGNINGVQNVVCKTRFAMMFQVKRKVIAGLLAYLSCHARLRYHMRYTLS